jgi:hypothetical protein
VDKLKRDEGKNLLVDRFQDKGSTRESVLIIGTRFSNLYTSVDTPARGRVVVCL